MQPSDAAQFMQQVECWAKYCHLLQESLCGWDPFSCLLNNSIITNYVLVLCRSGSGQRVRPLPPSAVRHRVQMASATVAPGEGVGPSARPRER